MLYLAQPLDTSDKLLMSDAERKAFMTVPPCPILFHPETPVGKSGYRGVRRHGRRYVARITWERKTHNLGTFPTAEEAARAYDAKARELHGTYALLNFPEREAA